MTKRILTLALAVLMAITMTVTAFAAEDVQVRGLTIPGVIKTTQYKLYMPGGNTERVETFYEVPVGTAMVMADGVAPAVAVVIEYDADRKTLVDHGADALLTTQSQVDVVGNKARVLSPGYYNLVFLQEDFFGVYLHVTDSESAASESTTTESTAGVKITISTNTKDPGNAATPAVTPEPEAPVGGNTVYVAGQNRTPGQIQNGVNGKVYTIASGDTFYDLAERFYGDGSIWPELYAANEENILATSGKTIFVGFNLIVPSVLDGVQSNLS
jgi:nucleoid-associated protein YgaU